MVMMMIRSRQQFCDNSSSVWGEGESADDSHEISSFIWFLETGTKFENVVCCKFCLFFYRLTSLSTCINSYMEGK